LLANIQNHPIESIGKIIHDGFSTKNKCLLNEIFE